MDAFVYINICYNIALPNWSTHTKD